MRRRAVAVRRRAVAACSACALLASACGDPAGRGFTPAGAVGSGAAVAPTGAPTPAVRTITAGPRLRVQIEWPTALDPAQTEMVAAFVDSYAGQWRAVGSLGKDQSYLDGVQDEASRDAYSWVHQFVVAKRSARGVARLYGLRVSSVAGRGAEVDACVDESGVRLTDRAGAPVADQPNWTRSPRSTYFQAAAVRQGDDGLWRVKLFRHAAYPDERAKECVR